MPATASVNNMTVVHKGSTGISQAFPDVCKTPAPPAPPIPIPYPNIAMSSDTADGSTTVTFDGNPIMLSTSKYAMSTGDEPGSLFGVMSNKNKGSANPQSWSMDVKVDGKNVFRQLDLMLHNGGSKPTNTPPGPNAQPPLPPGAPKKDKERKVVDVQWSHTKLKCGDLVKVHTKTENYDDGDPVLHVVHKNGSKRVHEMFTGSVSGNKIETDRITYNGRWQKKPTKLKVKVHGASGTKESSNELEIEIPPEGKDVVKVGWASNQIDLVAERVVSKTFLGLTIPFTKKKVVVKTGQIVAWDYGYDLTIKQGVLLLEHRSKIVPQLHVKTGKLRGLKKGWKREIETVWTRKWQEHRAACKRGDTCDCPGGCCIFPLNVKCKFVAGGEHTSVNLWPGKPTNAGQVGSNPDWWDSGNWYESLSGDEGNSSVVHAHEFGHTIGMPDEYQYTNDKTGELSSMAHKYRDVPGSIMQSGSTVMKHHIELYPLNGVSIHVRFQKLSGGGYKLLKM
jgi:hypothetical protein